MLQSFSFIHFVSVADAKPMTKIYIYYFTATEKNKERKYKTDTDMQAKINKQKLIQLTAVNSGKKDMYRGCVVLKNKCGCTYKK